MFRGTTPTHIFTLPFDTNTLKEVHIIYAQGDIPVITKTISDCTLDGKTITVKLSQEETFKLDCKKYVQIQIRVLTNSGEVLNSEVNVVRVEKCLENAILA